MQRSTGLFDVYMGLFAILSGYLVPLALLPGWIQVIADHAPLRHLISTPVEIMIGRARGLDAARLVAMQWGWSAVTTVLAFTAWRAGIRRFEAYGA
jgi:ABC-2 type transport system permease protein